MATTSPSIPFHEAATPPITAPDDLAEAQEDRVEAHDGAPILLEAFADVGQQAERRRRGPGHDEQGNHGHDPERHQKHIRRAPEMVDRQDVDRHGDERADASEQQGRPAETGVDGAPEEQAGSEDDGQDGLAEADGGCRDALHQELARVRARCP